MTAFSPIPPSGRLAYSAIHQRPDFTWPEGRRLAVYIGFNLEHFAFGQGLGAGIGPASPQPDVLNYSWREYGNRVGAWRCLELFDQLCLPTAALVNTALIEHAPELLQAVLARGDELVGHGHSNAFRQSDYSEAVERELLAGCRSRLQAFVEAQAQQPTPSAPPAPSIPAAAPAGWLSPWISESLLTPDLLAETGYAYTLNWCHDDQPTQMQTRSGQRLWSIPYPQELNDIPMIMGRQLDGTAFADMLVDNLDEMLAQTQNPKQPQSMVMGIALHPYIVGQPYRLRHLRRALQHMAAARDRGDIWFTTPGQICTHMQGLQP